MKIPKYIKEHIRKMSDLARKQQVMNNQLTDYLDKLGVDMDCKDFEDCFMSSIMFPVGISLSWFKEDVDIVFNQGKSIIICSRL